MRVLELLSCFNPGHLGTVVLDCSVVTDSDAKMSRRIRQIITFQNVMGPTNSCGPCSAKESEQS